MSLETPVFLAKRAPVKTVNCLDPHLGFVANMNKKYYQNCFYICKIPGKNIKITMVFPLQNEDTVNSQLISGLLRCRWSGSTGCSIAVGSCLKETLGEDGTLPLMACQTKAQWMPTAPQGEAVGSGEQCMPALGPNSSSTKWPPRATKATPSGPPSTAC